MRCSRRKTGLGGIVALSILFVGCENPSAPEPRTASEAGRHVFHPTTESDSAAARVTDSSDRPSDSEQATNTATGIEPVREPVAAPRPAVTPVAAGSAAMSIADAVNPAAAVETPAAPLVTDPNADPSQYPGGIVPASPNAQPLPGGPRLMVPERHFRADGRPRALRVTYDDLDLLKVLNMGDPLPGDVVDQFPDWLRELDGKVIRLRGFMYPAYEQELSAFVLTRDTGACCFGPNPKVYYLVGVKLKEGQKVRYIGDHPFDVVGTFHIAPVYNEGQWYQLYRISDATVIP